MAACLLPPKSRMPEQPSRRDDSSTDPERPGSGGPRDADNVGDVDVDTDPRHESHDPYQPL